MMLVSSVIYAEVSFQYEAHGSVLIMLLLAVGIWKVEVVTGKGLHSVKQNPKLLPAVKQYLAARLIEFWNAPGMVVFMLRPSAD